VGRRADSLIDSGFPAANWDGAGTNYIVQTPAGVLYMVYIDSDNDPAYRKSVDGGLTWSRSIALLDGTATNLAVWYDRWSNISAGLIHCAYTESGGSDTLYRTINTESSDALSTQTTIFAGASRLAGGHLSITRAVGGNVYCKTVIDAGSEGGFYRLANANVPNGAWDAARTVDEAIANLDQMLLLPDFDAADTQDIMALFQDASVTELSRKLYDDSANSWAETSISASITELATATGFRNFDAAPDIANTRHVVVAWNATDAANQDLLCWTVDSGAITAKTDVVTNATDDCGLAAISIDLQTGYWHVFYGGPSTGGSTWPTAMHVYMKVSTDQGTTWGPETLVDTHPLAFDMRNIHTCPRLYSGQYVVAYVNTGTIVRQLYINVDRTVPRAAYVLGV
jgi:hypothetical protein